jgi:hypothetical protein
LLPAGELCGAVVASHTWAVVLNCTEIAVNIQLSIVFIRAIIPNSIHEGIWKK